MQESQSTKLLLQKIINQIWRAEVFAIKDVQDTVPWVYLTENFDGKEIDGRFFE